MRTLHRPLLAATATALLLVGLGACSDDGDDSADTDATETTAAPESGSEPDEGGEAAGGDGVTMAGLAFDPDSLEVSTGTEVTWSNGDEATHTVTADDGGFDSGDIETGGTFSQTFDEAGTFSYVCAIHPNMAGEIVVG